MIPTKIINANKYRAKKTELDGERFPSKKEANRYAELKLLERAGEIRSLTRQVPFEILPSYTRVDGKKIRGSNYLADFVYDRKTTRSESGWETVIEDTKGYRTDLYKLKKKIVEWKYGIVIIET